MATHNIRRSRYKGSKVLQRVLTDPATGEEVTRHYLEGRFPQRKSFKDSVMHIVVGGEEDLDYLAFFYYGREDLWWIIADYNKIDDPNDVRAGDILEIPPFRVAGESM